MTHPEAAIYFHGELRGELEPLLLRPDQLFVPSDSDLLLELEQSIGEREPDSQITEALRRDLYRVVAQAKIRSSSLEDRDR